MKNLFKLILMSTFVFVVGGRLSAAEHKALLAAHMETASISMGFELQHDIDAMVGLESLSTKLREVDVSLIADYKYVPIRIEQPTHNVKSISTAMINKCAKESYRIVLMQKHRKHIERITGGH